MAAEFARRDVPLRVFTKFSDLPAEIRCLIWAKASPTRPRVIQIAYQAEKETWRSCVDSCGGLPKTIPACREARREALKPYTRLLETWVDLEEDTILISDPMFNIRKPRRGFMDSAFLSSIKRIAFTEDVYFGMHLLYDSFPELVDRQAAIVRKMQGLTHFTLVLMEDGGGFDEESDDVEFEFLEDSLSEIEEEEGNEDESNRGEEGQEEVPHEGATDDDAIEEGDEILDGYDTDGIEDEDQMLSLQEEEAMIRLRKGYFRNVGDIHFADAVQSPDFWDSWESYWEQINSDFDEQQAEVPEWSRPLVAIVEIKYGLHYIGQTPAIDWRNGHITEDDGSPAETTDDGT